MMKWTRPSASIFAQGSTNFNFGHAVCIMRVMPHTAPCASVPMHIVHVGGVCRASDKNSLYTAGLVEAKSTIPGALLLNFFLFSSCSLGFYGGMTSSVFFLSELLAVSCIQHLFLHLTPPNTYVAKAQLCSPPHPSSPRNVVSPLPSPTLTF